MAFTHDQLLYPMAHSNEWFDFDNSFEFPSGYLDSMPTSTDSISPEEYSLADSETGELNWSSSSGLFAQSSLLQPEQPMLDDHSSVGPVQDPSYLLNSPGMSPNMDLYGSPPVDDLSQDPSLYTTSSSVRQMVEAKASADFRYLSKKEKRREAAIAVHLRRLQDAVTADKDFSSDSNTSFSSPCWSDFVRESLSPQPPPTHLATTPSSSFTSSDNASSTPACPGNDGVPGGVEMVLDLNMNTATNLPKKQKPRSLAQKESYVKVRKHGACEKHRKQHKRCNCLEKNAARIENTTSTATTPTSSMSPLPQLTKQPVQNLSQGSSGKCPTATSRSAPANLLQVKPDPDRGLRDKYTCLMPGCTYSSGAVPSLKAHYARHSSRAVHGADVPVQPWPQTRELSGIRQPWRSFDHPPSTPFVYAALYTRSLPQDSARMLSEGVHSPTTGVSSTARVSRGTRVAHGFPGVSTAFSPSRGCKDVQQRTDAVPPGMARSEFTGAPPGIVVHDAVKSVSVPQSGALAGYASGVILQVVKHVLSMHPSSHTWKTVMSRACAYFGKFTSVFCRQILFANRGI